MKFVILLFHQKVTIHLLRHNILGYGSRVYVCMYVCIYYFLDGGSKVGGDKEKLSVIVYQYFKCIDQCVNNAYLFI